MHRWTKISSDFICILEKIVSGRDSALDPAGGAHDAPPDPQVRPRWFMPVRRTPYVPDCSAQIMVTLQAMHHEAKTGNFT